ASDDPATPQVDDPTTVEVTVAPGPPGPPGGPPPGESPQAIPTLDGWGMLLLGGGLAGAAAIRQRRRGAGGRERARCAGALASGGRRADEGESQEGQERQGRRGDRAGEEDREAEAARAGHDGGKRKERCEGEGECAEGRARRGQGPGVSR